MTNRALASTCGGRTARYPAIVLRDVVISGVNGVRHPQPWDALVDTGADRSVIPLAICRDLNLLLRSEIALEGFDSSLGPSRAGLYYASIQAKGFQPVTLLAAAVEKEYLLLGRDFLAELRLLLAVDQRTGMWHMGESGVYRSLLLWLAAM